MQKVPIEINQVLEDNFLLILKGFAVLVLLVEPVQSLPDYYGDVVPDFCPYVIVDLSVGGNASEDLILEMNYIKELFFKLLLFGFLISLECWELATFFYHWNLFFD